MKSKGATLSAEPSRREVVVADYAAVFDMLRRLSGFETAGRPKVNP